MSHRHPPKNHLYTLLLCPFSSLAFLILSSPSAIRKQHWLRTCKWPLIAHSSRGWKPETQGHCPVADGQHLLAVSVRGRRVEGAFLKDTTKDRNPSRDSPFLTSWPPKASPPDALTSEMKLQQISVAGHRHRAGSPGVPRQPLRQLPSPGQDPVAVYTYKRLWLIILAPRGPNSSRGRADWQESRDMFLRALLIPGTHEPSMPTLKTRRLLQGPHRVRAATSDGLCQPPLIFSLRS